MKSAPSHVRHALSSYCLGDAHEWSASCLLPPVFSFLRTVFVKGSFINLFSPVFFFLFFVLSTWRMTKERQARFHKSPRFLFTSWAPFLFFFCLSARVSKGNQRFFGVLFFFLALSRSFFLSKRRISLGTSTNQTSAQWLHIQRAMFFIFLYFVVSRNVFRHHIGSCCYCFKTGLYIHIYICLCIYV